jgi:hypothetical protein
MRTNISLFVKKLLRLFCYANSYYDYESMYFECLYAIVTVKKGQNKDTPKSNTVGWRSCSLSSLCMYVLQNWEILSHPHNYKEWSLTVHVHVSMTSKDMHLQLTTKWK